MTKRKNTKRTLLLSALSLLMCVSLLIGSTFAWFTDSVTSANNIIQSGNLDIELEYWKDGAWENVEGKSDILTNTLWEPGVTEVAYLRVANAGSLALKYQLGVNIKTEKPGVNAAGETFKLSDYILFGVEPLSVDGNGVPATYATREDAIADLDDVKKISAGYMKESYMESGDELYLALVVYMPTTTDNRANHNGTDVPKIELGINVVATQYTFEEDSFGPDYDKDAVYPVVENATKNDNTGLTIGNGEVKIDVPAEAPAGEYTIEITNKNVATDATGKTTVDYDISLAKDGVKITAPDGTITYEVNINIGKNLDVATVTHKGVALDHFAYDPVTGIVTFETASFSPYAIVYTVADDTSVFVPADPEVAEKIEKEAIIAVDENGNEFTTLAAAVKSGASKLYLKAGADLGTVTHLDVANDLVIYGNGAYISGGERDLAIDTYVQLTKDITVTVYNLHGIAAWGQRNTAYTVNLNLYNCNDIGRVYLNGNSGVNNIALYNCTASVGNAESYKNLVGDTVVYSNANGELIIDGCTFTRIGCPVNLNHKIAGEQTVTVTNTTFVDCSTEGTAAYYAPIRLYNSVEGANQTVTVEGNTFTYTEGKAPINNADVMLNVKHNGVDAAGTIQAKVQENAKVACGANVIINGAPVITSEEELKAALENATAGTTINVSGVTLAPTGSLSDTVKIPAGVTLKGAKFAADSQCYLVTYGTGEAVVFEECEFDGPGFGMFVVAGNDQDGAAMVFENCTFKGQVAPNFVQNSNGSATFNNCLFTVGSDNIGLVNCMGGTHTFNSCTFDYTGGATFGSNQYVRWNAVNSYSENYSTKVILNGCTFKNCGTQRFGSNSTLTVK